MYVLGPRSIRNLAGVHPDLVRVVNRAMSHQIMDFTVSEGLRTKERQIELVEKGRSKTLNSKHLVQSDGYGHAVDLYPFPIEMWACDNPRNKNHTREISRFGLLAGIMISCAREEKVGIIWGGDWDRDGQTIDHTFFDAPHFELIGD